MRNAFGLANRQVPLEIKLFTVMGLLRQLFIPQQIFKNACELTVDSAIALICVTTISLLLAPTIRQIQLEGWNRDTARGISRIALASTLLFFNRNTPAAVCTGLLGFGANAPS